MIRRLLLLDQPQETRFFLFVGGFGLVLGLLYWFLSYEIAGTLLLLGFGLAGGIIGLRLVAARPAGLRRGRTAGRGSGDADSARQLADGDAADLPGGGTGGIDVPFEDESGRLPEETLAPLAIGLGVALAITAIVFGPWLLIAGIVPLGWGAWSWLSGARDELDATEASDLVSGGAAPRPRT